MSYFDRQETSDLGGIDGFHTLVVSSFVNRDQGRSSPVIDLSPVSFFLTSDICVDLSKNSGW